MTIEEELVTVLEVDNPIQQSLVESVLTDSGIDHIVRHQGVQHLIGAGQLGGRNFLTGPVVIQVRPADVERARQLIADALSVPEIPPED